MKRILPRWGVHEGQGRLAIWEEAQKDLSRPMNEETLAFEIRGDLGETA